MNKTELLKRCGYNKNELINTNLGLMDVFRVKNGMVSYGFLAKSRIPPPMPIADFIAKFSEAGNV